MLEISTKNYDEMQRYERYMDNLRALAIWITGARDDTARGRVFGEIKNTHTYLLPIYYPRIKYLPVRSDHFNVQWTR